jgi:hypothetical protein
MTQDQINAALSAGKQAPFMEQARKVAEELDDFNSNLDRKAARVIRGLLDRLEKSEKDAERWSNLCELINDDRVSVTFYGRVDTINSGLEVHDSGDLHDELDIAMEASK